MGASEDSVLVGSVDEATDCAIHRDPLQVWVEAAIARTNHEDGPSYLRTSQIYGIRAIAIIGVLGFHFNARQVSGGFLGIDMFFVLSGFLMTRDLLQRACYELSSCRRVVLSRVLKVCPALFSTVFCSLVCATVFFPEYLLPGICKSSLAAILFSTNVKYFLEGGNQPAEALLKPLLHTWSLSVEGHFYTVWSVLGHFLCRPEEFMRGVFATSLASLLAGLLIQNRMAHFFLSPFRMCQFGAGGSAVLLYDIFSPQGSNILQGIGCGLIIGSFYYATPEQDPLSMPTLAVVLGTVLLLATPRASLARRVLDHHVTQYVGKVSYSIYLVHWPILCFSKMAIESRFHALLVSLVFTSIASAALFYGVENQFRNAKRAKATSGYLLCILLVFCVVLYALVILGGMRSVETMKTRAKHPRESLTPRTSNEFKTEMNEVLDSLRSSGAILSQSPRRGEYYMVFGDSYARNLLGPIQQTSNSSKFVFLSSPDCMFMAPGRVMRDPSLRRADEFRKCDVATKYAERVLKQYPAETLVLAARWQDYVFDPVSMQRMSIGFQRFSKLAKRTLVVGVVPKPRMENTLQCLWQNVDDLTGNLRNDAFLRCPREFKLREEDSLASERLSRWMKAKFPQMTLVSPLESDLCIFDADTYVCQAWNRTATFYYDSLGHMTLTGSKLAMSAIKF